MSDKLDLKNLKREIDARKKEMGDNLSEGKINDKVAKDRFLNGLLNSLNSGQPTEASQRIKAVDESAEKKILTKKGGVPTSGKSSSMSEELATLQPNTSASVNNVPTNAPDRDELLNEEYKRREKEYLDGLRAGYGNPNPNPNVQASSQQHFSHGNLNESVKRVIDENFAHIVGEALKDAIVEVYTNEKVREIMLENRDTIRKVVIETIRDLQKKKKPQS